MKKKRQSTVEPIFGSLINYYGMRKVNVKGIKQANKVMLAAATAYNIMKLLKFSKLHNNKDVKTAQNIYTCLIIKIMQFLSRYKQALFSPEY